MEKQNLIQENVVLGLLAEMVWDEALRTFRKKRLYEEIDRALAENNQERFFTLTEELRNLLDDERT